MDPSQTFVRGFFRVARVLPAGFRLISLSAGRLDPCRISFEGCRMNLTGIVCCSSSLAR